MAHKESWSHYFGTCKSCDYLLLGGRA